MKNRFLLAGAVFGGAAVALGAFGAHALADVLTDREAAVYETAVRYQMYHALALLVVAWLARMRPPRLAPIAGYLFIAGICVFSGSLYLLLLTGASWWGAITPVGGTAFIVGWIILAWHALKAESNV